MPARRSLCSIFLLLLLLLLLLALPATPQQPSEYQLKAAFLLNFTKFVEWPAAAFEEPGSPITICILGEDPFGATLNQLLEGEVVNGRKVGALRIRRSPAPKSCQVLFVGGSEKDVSKILAGLGPGVLTVGEGGGFLRDGGMIAFVMENRRVRFEINQGAATNASLTMSSRLLSVARNVEK